MNFGVESRSPEFHLFETIGIPTVVVVNVDLTIHAARIQPGLALVAVRKLQRRTDETSIVSEIAIGRECIERLEHPESEFWDRFVWTPRNGCE